MRRLVNGDEVELGRIGAETASAGDRWLVRSPSGVYSALAVKTASGIFISYKGTQYQIETRRSGRQVSSPAESGEIRASMPGLIVDVRRSYGDSVRRGDTILVLEAMKTQQPLKAPFDGTILQIHVQKGEQVNDGTLLAKVESLEKPDA